MKKNLIMKIIVTVLNLSLTLMMTGSISTVLQKILMYVCWTAIEKKWILCRMKLTICLVIIHEMHDGMR